MSPDEEIFGDALAQSTVERAAFLDRACAGNPMLRARLDELFVGHGRRPEDAQIMATSTSGPKNEITLWRVADGQKVTSFPAPGAGFERFTSFAATGSTCLTSCRHRGSVRPRIVLAAFAPTAFPFEQLPVVKGVGHVVLIRSVSTIQHVVQRIRALDSQLFLRPPPTFRATPPRSGLVQPPEPTREMGFCFSESLARVAQLQS